MKNNNENLYYYDKLTTKEYINLSNNKNVKETFVERKSKTGETVRRIIDGKGDWTNYAVSDLGNVYEINDEGYLSKMYPHKKYNSVDKINGTVDLNDYYLNVRLNIWYKMKKSNKLRFGIDVGIHILVADAFLKPVEDFYIVDHIDMNKANNNLKNLRRTNNKGNSIAFVKGIKEIDPYFFENIKRPVVGKRSYTDEQVEEACKLLQEEKLFIYQIANKTGIPSKTVGEIKNKRIYKNISDKYDFSKYNLYANVKYLTEDNVKEIDELLREGKTVEEIVDIMGFDPTKRRAREVINERRKELISGKVIAKDTNEKYKEAEEKQIAEYVRKGYKPSVIAKMMNHENDSIYTGHVSYIRSLIMEKEGYILFNDLFENMEEYEKHREKSKNDIDLVHEICRRLEKNEESMKSIAKDLHVRKTFVESIRYKHTWVDISANYNFDNFNQHETAVYANEENNKKVRELLLSGKTPGEVCKEMGYQAYDKNLPTKSKATKFYTYVSHQRDLLKRNGLIEGKKK